ncbi:MAG: TadE/TadG family type IV pilus assembly protein [Bacillota bacterium]
MRSILGRLKRLKCEEKGQSLVEFALVLLPLLLLLLGIIEFGWLFNGQITVTSAAREAARAVAVGEDPWTAVNRHIMAANLTVTDILVTPGGSETDKWNLVQVQASIEPLVGFFVTNTVNLSAEATMRME